MSRGLLLQLHPLRWLLLLPKFKTGPRWLLLTALWHRWIPLITQMVAQAWTTQRRVKNSRVISTAHGSHSGACCGTRIQIGHLWIMSGLAVNCWPRFCLSWQ